MHNPAGINVFVGDMLDDVQLNQALLGQDVVIAGLSGTKLQGMAKNLVQAAENNQIKHIFWITGMEIHHEVKGIRGLILNSLAKSMPEYVKAADIIANSSINSTLLRLPTITNGNQTKFYLNKEGERSHSFSVSRKALAKAIIYMLGKTNFNNESIAVTI